VDQVEKAVFLATTNYPERLGARILNRPSRFDKRFKIDHPNEESRMLYFRYLVGGGLHGDTKKEGEVNKKIKELGIDLECWVTDTDRFSIAHLKELFIAVVILKDEYEDAIATLGSMKEFISSDDDREKMVGFAPHGTYKTNKNKRMRRLE
jgi:SpoVK/Ycf46/Vps4 family AAA+-type ATPase